MIMNTITIVDLLNISIHNHNTNSTMKYHSFRLHFISSQESFAGKFAHVSYKLAIYSDSQTVYYHDSE